MTLLKINPHIRYARRHNGAFRVRRNISVCYDARFFYFKNAKGSITVNGQKHEIKNKTAIYLPPESRYSFNLKFDENIEVCILDFDLTAEHEHIKKSFGTASVSDFDPTKVPKYEIPTEFSCPIIKETSNLSHLIYGTIEKFEGQGMYSREQASAILKLVLLEFIDSSSMVHSPLCEKIPRYVEDNYQDPSLTNEMISESLNYHPYYVNRVFKREMGESLRSYIINYRIRAAKELLSSSDLSISEVAYRSGFSSSSYFVKMFREHVGVTPREYKRSMSAPEL